MVDSSTRRRIRPSCSSRWSRSSRTPSATCEAAEGRGRAQPVSAAGSGAGRAPRPCGASSSRGGRCDSSGSAARVADGGWLREEALDRLGPVADLTLLVHVEAGRAARPHERLAGDELEAALRRSPGVQCGESHAEVEAGDIEKHRARSDVGKRPALTRVEEQLEKPESGLLAGPVVQLLGLGQHREAVNPVPR